MDEEERDGSVGLGEHDQGTSPIRRIALWFELFAGVARLSEIGRLGAPG